jgi:hypothetical protein
MNSMPKDIDFENVYETHRIAYYGEWVIIEILGRHAGYPFDYYAFLPGCDFTQAEYSSLDFLDDYFGDALFDDDLQELLREIDLNDEEHR